MSLNQICSRNGTNTFNPDVSFRNISTSQETTNKLIVAGGSASAPSITFQNDTDTGIYSAGANTVNISTGGALKVQVDSTNNINALTPIRIVDNFASPNIQYNFFNDANFAGLFLSGTSGGYISFGQPLGENFDLRIRTETGNVNSVATKNDMTFCDETYSDFYFSVDKTNKGVRLPINASSPAGYTPTTFRVYEEYDIANTPVLGFTDARTTNIKLTRFGNRVSLQCTGINATGNGALLTIAAGTLPARFRPSAQLYCPINGYQNGNNAFITVYPDTTGGISFSSSADPTAVFTPATGAGFRDFCITYFV